MRSEAALDRGSLLALIVRAGRNAENAAETALAQYGLRYDMWAVLDLLDTRGTFSMAEIADEVVVPPPTLTRVIDKLIADGLVHRLSDPADRRRVLARLTRRGQRLHNEIAPAVALASESTISPLTDSQRNGLESALRAAVAPILEDR